ncbi:hypothetical protein ES705_10078 [subsurface metagenome]
MNTKELRECVILRYKNGKSPKKIYRSLGKSKALFFKWLKDSKFEKESLPKSQSHKLHKKPQGSDKKMEQMVFDNRKYLENKL